MCRVASVRSICSPHFALAVAISLGAAACSTDTERFRASSGPSNTRPVADVGETNAVTPAPVINSTALPPPPAVQSTPIAAPLAPPPASRSVASAPATPAVSAPYASSAPAKSVASARSVPAMPARQAAAAPAATSPAPAAPAAGNLPKYLVVAGDTLHKIARQYRVSVADLAAVNKISPRVKLKPGEQLALPARATPVVAATPASAPQKLAATTKTNSPLPLGSAHSITPTPDLSAETGGSQPGALTFRWPVRGRILSGWGPKPNGQENPGINISVPEGTPIKAAEDGEVVYASNALTTFGNLVLIRHANNFVTAYAHASEILVKRGDHVKRGQVIAKSGQTGNVTAPQLHFQIRKGPTPVDPMPFLDRSGPAA